MNQLIPKLTHSVVKICILLGVKYQELSKEIKKAYLKEASLELEYLGEKVNLSRLSVITGLQRKEIEALISVKKNNIDPLEHKVSLISKVIGLWQFHPRYKNKDGKDKGKVKELTYKTIDSEFSTLIKSISQDLHAGTILFELERLNLIEKKANKIKLLSQVSKYDSKEESLSLLVSDINILTNSVTENYKNSNSDIEITPNLHALTEFNKISKEDEEEIKAWVLKEGSLFHKKVRTYLSSKDLDYKKNKDKTESYIKVSVGAFSLISEDNNNKGEL